MGVRFHHWRLGFRQSSFRPITRVLQDHVFSVFQHLLLLGHAVFPSGFRLQVNPMTQKRPSEFLLSESGIQHYVPRRTFSRIQLSDKVAHTFAHEPFRIVPRDTDPTPR